MTQSDTLFVFMDESGNMQFGNGGTQHFVLSAVYTSEPEKSAALMQELKYDLMAKGSEDLDFHATNNSKGTRKRVVDRLAGCDHFSVHSLWIDKGFTAPSLQNEISLFTLFGKAMGRWVNATQAKGYDKIVLVFDSVLTGKKQDAFIKDLKPALKKLGKEFKVLFHPVKQDLNGQIADYYSWSLFRRLEVDDSEHYKQLKGTTRWTEFDLFNQGHTRYWEK
ncbi:DUF3800 domain-containing protein [Corynebacterium cystitidis]|uniref:DUF3800 domain-containing protein n=1 Tax=Corynebacterium cystitidis TaxID=35757 RepID=UPI00211EDA73|nr:DUF3800 domain-containing protein [Corynebacterium cystitidis]